ncbi:MAG: hypothetical protein GX847_03915, partial [Clostridiales bacterium]|nr:hypothetical protein [Clostridiales bacterium]
GQMIFCKGTNFIQSDCLYARITDQLQEKLLRAARDAGFNMLRFWDGAMYQRDYVFELCDQYGILAYQDFNFACGAYPDHLEEFCREVEKEAVYQIRRLRSHPCIALWCGCGECVGLLANFLERNFFAETDPAFFTGGTYLYGQLLPRLHHALVDTVSYQCCSPFGGFADQQVPEQGDMHFYPFLDLRPENQQNRISTESFNELDCKFLTEGGAMGPPSAEALARYCGGKENCLPENPIFEHHRNTFERDAVRDGIFKHYTGKRELSLEEYCLYGGLFQGTLLSYAADHLRLCENCNGVLFWCLNDGFGEVGFSVMDHDGNPKPAYYFLRRAYGKNRIVLRQENGLVKIYCGNDKSTSQKVHITCGYVSFEGAYGKKTELTAELPPFTKASLVGTIPVEQWDLRCGAVYAKSENEDILTAVLRVGDFRQLCLPREANLTVHDVQRQGSTIRLVITADVFAHAVHLQLDAAQPVSDAYFDLLPGESRCITIFDAENLSTAAIHSASVFTAAQKKS